MKIQEHCWNEYENYISVHGIDDVSANIATECESINSYIISDYVMLGIQTVLLLPLVIITVKVKKIIWKQDKVIVLMLICLTASVVSFVVYFLYNITMEYRVVWQYSGKSFNCSS
jgi:hypothetical protein